MAAFFVGAWHLYEAVFRSRFYGPMKPQDLLEREAYLADDAAFEIASLPAVAAAFETNLSAATAQAYQIHRAGRLVGAAVILLAMSVICYAASEIRDREKGAGVSRRTHDARHREGAAPADPAPRPRRPTPGPARLDAGDSSLSAKSPFQPYVIWRGGGDTPKPVRK